MENSKTISIRSGWTVYYHWKETGYHDFIEGLWHCYSVENPEKSFTEYYKNKLS